MKAYNNSLLVFFTVVGFASGIFLALQLMHLIELQNDFAFTWINLASGLLVVLGFLGAGREGALPKTYDFRHIKDGSVLTVNLFREIHSGSWLKVVIEIDNQEFLATLSKDIFVGEIKEGGKFLKGNDKLHPTT
jgi:hypothetical protein